MAGRRPVSPPPRGRVPPGRWVDAGARAAGAEQRRSLGFARPLPVTRSSNIGLVISCIWKPGSWSRKGMRGSLLLSLSLPTPLVDGANVAGQRPDVYKDIGECIRVKGDAALWRPR